MFRVKDNYKTSYLCLHMRMRREKKGEKKSFERKIRNLEFF